MLNNDLNIMIFNYLNDRDLYNMFRVNKSCHSMLFNPNLWLNRINKLYPTLISKIIPQLTIRLKDFTRDYYSQFIEVNNKNMYHYLYEGTFEQIILALHLGANINHSNICTNPPLLVATSNGSYDKVKFLLNNKADINIKNPEKHTALCIASTMGYDNIVTLLISYGANINHTDYYGETPLMHSISHRNYEIAIKLIELGADINKVHKYGWSALSYACRYGNYEIFKLLLDMGADTNIVDHWGETLLTIATTNRTFLNENNMVIDSYSSYSIIEHLKRL